MQENLRRTEHKSLHQSIKLVSKPCFDGTNSINIQRGGKIIVHISVLFHMAPERLRPHDIGSLESTFTQEADIYSFGMIMYQVLFRMEPFEEEFASSAGL